MFVPLVDILRCVRPHDDTWLVASIDRADDRDIVTGTLGCPICLSEYPIREGVVYFASERPSDADAAPASGGARLDDDAMRIAATLELTDARMIAVLQGAAGESAQVLRGLSPAQQLLVNAPPRMISGDGISIVVADTAPLAQGSVDAIAVDASASEPMIASLVRSLRAKGRMLGPASLAVPEGLVEIARDAQGWVARLDVKETVSAPIQLKRRDT